MPPSAARSGGSSAGTRTCSTPCWRASTPAATPPPSSWPGSRTRSAATRRSSSRAPVPPAPEPIRWSPAWAARRRRRHRAPEAAGPPLGEDPGPRMEAIETDLLILGGGGAGLCAALHAADRAPGLGITLVVKGLLGRAGCTRMVQGGYNAVLRAPDSLEAHLLDTLRGGGFLNDQELVWRLVDTAPARVAELEDRYGCFFDRNADGAIDQKPFAG